MNLQPQIGKEGLSPRTKWLRRGLTALILLTMVYGPILVNLRLPASPAVAQAPTCATPGSFTLDVREFVDVTTPGVGAAVTPYTYIVNEDNAGDPYAALPVDRPGMGPMSSYSPIVAAGDETAATITLPDGRYLVSVRSAGFKLWGRHVRLQGGCVVDLNNGTNPPSPVVNPTGVVLIELVSDPLPLSQLKVFVFHDNFPLNSAPAGSEPGLEGFHVLVRDGLDDVTVDWFGNPICTDYYAPGVPPDFLPPHPTHPGLGADTEGNPVPIPHTGGKCVTGPDTTTGNVTQGGTGSVTIRWLPYGQYDTFVIPPDGEGWIQTTTFEGKKRYEHTRIMEGDNGFGATYEANREGLILPTAFWYGFAKECQFGNLNDTCPAFGEGVPNVDISGTATINGTVVDWTGWPPFEEIVYNEPVYRPWIALNQTGVGALESQMYTGRGNPDGSFTIPDVPAGTYSMAIWDEPLDYIITYRSVIVPDTPNAVVDMGTIGIFRWFGWESGYVFMDDGLYVTNPATGATALIPGPDQDGNPRDNNGIRDCVDPVALTGCERGIPGLDLDIRFRDGSVKSATFTDRTGYYEFPEELGPMFKFDIAEVGFGRHVRTGHSWHNDLLNNPFGDHDSDGTLNNADPDLATVQVIDTGTGGGLLLNMLTLEGKRNWIDWGKVPYEGNDNGGIAGIVFYGTTRNEFDARLQANEDYEPAIPGVTMRLWGAGPDGILNTPDTPSSDDVLLNELQTDAWEQPTGCDVTNRNGLLLSASTTIQQTAIYSFTYLFHDILNASVPGVECIEYPLLSNEVQPGAFDGGFQFESMFPAGFPNGAEVEPLPPGDYIVEVVPPPFYQIVKEEDVNVDEGDELTPIPLLPPAPCVGPLHLVSDVRSPFDGDMMPLCTRRLVTVQPRQNPEANFFMMTDVDADPNTNTVAQGSWSTTEAVPIPGRIIGLVTDDFVRDTNPNSVWYGEERALQYTPVGIRDFTGRLLTTLHSDENGWYEVLLPSTYQMNCPIPTGVCPGMYVVRVNDPGDLIPAIPPDAPNYIAPNANYRRTFLTEPAPFQVWPGKMTKADTPIDPTGWWSCAPLNNPSPNPFDPLFGQPVDVEFFSVSRPYGPVGTTFGIYGLNFGAITGTLTLDGFALPIVSWSNEVITATVAGPVGPHQMLINTSSVDNMPTSLTGLTFHVIGGSYTPNIVTVSPPLLPGTPAIQPAIDTAPLNSLIVVTPGAYHESPILHRAVRLQGYGPGGIAGAINPLDPFTALEEPRFNVLGSFIEGRFFETYRTAWLTGAAGYGYTGSAGAAVTVFGNTPGEFTATSYPMVDGFWITGGRGDVDGGGVNVDGNSRFLRISNNILENNGGARGGGIGVGRRLVTDSNNDNVRISYNRIVNNGSLAQGGGIAVFGGANGYRVNNNDICGNYSGEYGGGIAHYGLSPNARIDNNHIHLNDAFDEGGGILIAGNDLDTTNGLGLGSGRVDILANRVSGNFSNDDGGGIRLLRALNYRVDIVNNMIQHNMAADHGGGISLDDSSNVNIVNNSIVRNFSTSTSTDRLLGPDPDGAGPLLPPSLPRGAGLTSQLHSALFAPGGTAPDGSTFSDPVLFNNIFESNQSYYFDPNITPVPEDPAFPEPPGPGPGPLRVPLVPAGPAAAAGDPLNNSWDLEVIYDGQGNGCFNATYNMFAQDTDIGGALVDFGAGIPSQPYGPDDLNGCLPGLLAAPGNTVGQDTMFLRPRGFEEFSAIGSLLDPNFISVEFWRAEGGEGFISSADFHIMGGSLAIDAGIGADPLGSGYFAPNVDFDAQPRPMGADWDVGADEVPSLFFSTAGDTPVPGVPPDVVGPAFDNADIYAWNGTTFSRVFDATAAGLGGGADVDALMVAGPNVFYMSFAANAGTTVPGLGTVQDEDIVVYNAGTATWSWFFDGSDVGLGDGGNNEDVDAFEILPGGAVIISTLGDPTVPALPTQQDEDLLRCVGTFVGSTTTCAWTVYFNGTLGTHGLTAGSEDVDGAAVSNGRLYLTTLGAFTVPISGGNLSGGGNDVFACNTPTITPTATCTGGFSMVFDGSSNGINDNLDGIDLP